MHRDVMEDACLLRIHKEIGVIYHTYRMLCINDTHLRMINLCFQSVQWYSSKLLSESNQRSDRTSYCSTAINSHLAHQLCEVESERVPWSSIGVSIGSTTIARKKIARTTIGHRQLGVTKIGRYENWSTALLVECSSERKRGREREWDRSLPCSLIKNNLKHGSVLILLKR